jgi:enoyl-CoA hydratase
MEPGGLVVVDRHAGHAVLTLNRPEKLNALNAAVLTDLDAALAELARDKEIRAVVIRGAGDRAFCAGADLAELHGLGTAAAVDVLEYGQDVISRLAAMPVPVIAAVHGHAVGGGFEIALAATFVLGSTAATFALPETGLGLIPGYGGTQRLARLIGRQRAGYVVTTGTRLTADDAYRLGILVEAPFAPEALYERAGQLATDVAGRGRLATTASLRLLAASEDGLAAGLRHETHTAALMVGSGEAAERIDAFLRRSSGANR